jgi:hypothetical protein
MSHISKKQRGKIPCEFAALGDCPSDDDYCRTYQDPDDCEKYHRKMVLEGEESQESFRKWMLSNSQLRKDTKLG